jgi:hypothetical protein
MPDYVIPPAGISAASFFTPTAFADPAQPLGVLADDLDGAGDLRSVIRGADPVDAAIAYQFRLKRGTGAVVFDQGQDFESIQKNDSSTPNALRFEARRVLDPFVAAGVAEVISVDVLGGEDAGDLGAVSVRYRNLRTGKVVPE